MLRVALVFIITVVLAVGSGRCGDKATRGRVKALRQQLRQLRHQEQSKLKQLHAKYEALILAQKQGISKDLGGERQLSLKEKTLLKTINTTDGRMISQLLAAEKQLVRQHKVLAEAEKARLHGVTLKYKQLILDEQATLKELRAKKRSIEENEEAAPKAAKDPADAPFEPQLTALTRRIRQLEATLKALPRRWLVEWTAERARFLAAAAKDRQERRADVADVKKIEGHEQAARQQARSETNAADNQLKQQNRRDRRTITELKEQWAQDKQAIHESYDPKIQKLQDEIRALTHAQAAPGHAGKGE